MGKTKIDNGLIPEEEERLEKEHPFHCMLCRWYSQGIPCTYFEQGEPPGCTHPELEDRFIIFYPSFPFVNGCYFHHKREQD